MSTIRSPLSIRWSTSSLTAIVITFRVLFFVRTESVGCWAESGGWGTGTEAWVGGSVRRVSETEALVDESVGWVTESGTRGDGRLFQPKTDNSEGHQAERKCSQPSEKRSHASHLDKRTKCRRKAESESLAPSVTSVQWHVQAFVRKLTPCRPARDYFGAKIWSTSILRGPLYYAVFFFKIWYPRPPRSIEVWLYPS